MCSPGVVGVVEWVVVVIVVGRVGQVMVVAADIKNEKKNISKNLCFMKTPLRRFILANAKQFYSA